MRFNVSLSAFMSAAIFLLAGTQAFAAGYACLSVDRDTRVIVQFEPQLTQAKQVVFIDPTLSKRSQTVAFFSAADGVLNSQSGVDGQRFTALVTPSTPHQGRRLGGTRIGLLSQVVIDVQTITRRQRIQRLTEGSMYAATVSYLKKDGQVLTQDFDCAVFLGDEAPDFDAGH